MFAQAILILSSIARFEGKNDKALDYINNGIKKCSLNNEINLLKIHKANILIDLGDRAAAKSIIDQILEREDISIANKQLAQKILGKLMT